MLSRKGGTLILLVLAALLLFDFTLRVSVALSNGIESDGAMHAMLAREISRTLCLQPYYPHFVTGQGTFYPVAYPQFFFVILSVFYTLGGELGMKLLGPILGTLTVFAVFLYARKLFDSTVALIASFLLVGESSLFTVTVEPFMESAVILFSVGALFEYLLYISKGRKQDLILSSLFMGLLLATKQQGILVAVVVCVFTLMITIKQIYEKKINLMATLWRNGKSLFILLVSSLLIASPFLYFQISTTGTIDYPPASGITRLFFKPNWNEDRLSIEWISSRATYHITPLDSLLFFFLAQEYSLMSFPFVSILIILGFIYLILRKQHHDFLFLIVSFATVCLSVMSYMNSTWRYFSTLPVLSVVIASLGASWILEKLRQSNLPKIDLTSMLGRIKIIKKEVRVNIWVISFIILFLVIPMFVNIQNNYITYYRGSDRTTGGYWPDRILKVEEAANWLRNHTTTADVILVDRWNEVGYYSERTVLCINELGGHDIPKIYSANSPNEAIEYLREYNITYIWISQLQIDRGIYEWIPRHGLLDFIDFAPQYFQKVYQNDLIRIYQVLKSPNENSLSSKHYYANVLGDFDDVYDVSPVVVTPTNAWSLSPLGRRLSANETGLIHVYVNQTELHSDRPTTLVLYYWDTSTERIDIDLRVTDEKQPYANIAQIYGNADGYLKWKIIQVNSTQVPILIDRSNAFYIEFRVTTNASDLELRLILLIPESVTLTDDTCKEWATWLIP